MTSDIGARLAAIDQALAAPPRVHQHLGAEHAWGTERECYALLAQYVGPGSQTLETGLGISTQLFAAWGADHTCVVPFHEEVEALRSHCDAQGIDLSHVNFAVEPSDTALPRLAALGGRIDVLFIDGGHGFPLPVIDWHYGNLMLRSGGMCVLDDIQLPHVANFLGRFLLADDRWTIVAKTQKWLAVQKTDRVPDREEWVFQPFVRFTATPSRILQVAEARGRRWAAPAVRRLRGR